MLLSVVRMRIHFGCIHRLASLVYDYLVGEFRRVYIFWDTKLCDMEKLLSLWGSMKKKDKLQSFEMLEI